MCQDFAGRFSVEAAKLAASRRFMTKPDPDKGFQSSPEIIHLVAIPYVRCPLSLRNVEDLLHGRGVAISRETVRFWLHRLAHVRNVGSG
jgi:transposase-like protein